MHVLGTAFITLMEVSLCILTRVSLVMRCSSPMQRASLGRMFVLNVKTTRITGVPIVDLLGDVRMWGINNSTCCANTEARGNLVSPWHEDCSLSGNVPSTSAEGIPSTSPSRKTPSCLMSTRVQERIVCNRTGRDSTSKMCCRLKGLVKGSQQTGKVYWS